jgi:hypothetical protein
MLNYYYFLTNDNKVSFFEIGEKVFIKWSVIAGVLVYA